MTWGNPVRNEYYSYDENGRRIAMAAVQNGVTTVTYYPFAHYEQKVSGGSTGVTKYYFFGGERFAMRTGSGAGVLRLLFKDRISSTMHVTDGAGNQVANAGYFPFGATMRSTGTMPTDHLFTDQQQDGSGLYYYGARYYDPTIGHFISPDTMIPDPMNVMDYQRYMYVRGNPLKYNDPTGRYSVDELQQHFGVNSFDELMAIFGEGGQYEGNSGWYDILRTAQDGDLITAYLPDATTSLSGSFIRSAEGRIMIDMGNGQVVSESAFAVFGGYHGGFKASGAYGSDYGLYHLNGAIGRWATATSGTQAINDTYGPAAACRTWDCVAIGLDVASAGYAYTSELSFWSTPVTTIGGVSGFTYGKFAQYSTAAGSVAWVQYQYIRGNASDADLWVTRVTATAGLVPAPIIGPAAATFQLAWDVFDPIHPW